MPSYKKLQDKIPVPLPTINSLLDDDRVSFRNYQLSGSEKKTMCIDVKEYNLNQPKATIILGHCMFSKGNYLCKQDVPTISSFYLDNNYRVLIPFASLPGEKKCFDDLIKSTTDVIEHVSKTSNQPIYLVGHSLSGIAYLAQQSICKHKQVKGIITLGSAPWNKELVQKLKLKERLRIHFICQFLRIMAHVFGYIPANKLRFGSVNETDKMVRQVTLNNYFYNQFMSNDKSIDYLKSIEKLDCQVLCLSSDSDEIANTELVKAFGNKLKNIQYINTSNLNHMELVSSTKNWTNWNKMLNWIECID